MDPVRSDAADPRAGRSGERSRRSAYDQLPAGPSGGRLAWSTGHLAQSESVGLIHLQTPARVLAASALIRTGAVFSLNAPVDLIDPPLFGRHGYAHSVVETKTGLDDRIDRFFPQSSSQWDSLGHIAYAPGVFYNGATTAEVHAGRRNTVDAWARRGIAGRAVLVDVARTLQRRYSDYDPVRSTVITVEDLEETWRAAGVEHRDGDVLLLHTGWLSRYVQLPRPQRAALARDRLSVSSVGLEHTEKMARYLWNAGVCAVATDNPTVEVWPPDESDEAAPFGYLHRILIGAFGMALGELWWLADLADDSAQDGRYEMFLTSAPLNIPGGIGSPANALAIK